MSKGKNGGSQSEAWRAGGWAGPLAAGLFLTSLLGFAAKRADGYTHATKAVSELGAIGAPDALAFNLLGFIVPGLLIAVLAAALWPAARGAGRVGPFLLALCGVAVAAAGVFPVDMAARASTTSVLHASAAVSSGVLWALALFPLGSLLRRTLGLSLWGALTPWFLLFLVGNIAWQVAYAADLHAAPGYGQRFGFAGVFLWAAVTGVLVARLGPLDRRTPAAV